MARLTTPNRGQPLDVDYISNIVGEVNRLTDIVGNSSTSFSNINDVNIKTPNLKFFAKRFNLSSTTTTSSGSNVSLTVDYPAFNGFPIVTSTVVTNAAHSVGDSIFVVMKSITSTQAKFVVTFTKAGRLDIVLNVMAIGLNQV